jgi:cellulose synthase/poly-beta-1,6-N-acetylglucosamine synthase-like glycosyltransferase
MMYQLVHTGQWLFLGYFLIQNGAYLLLNLSALFALRDYAMGRRMDVLPKAYSDYEMPITVIVPAYNEEATIVASVRALMQLRFPEYEIVVVNDGSRDDTMQELIAALGLRLFPEAYRQRLPTAEIHAVYRSTLHPNIRVIDKSNGGKADALNAGINASRYPLFCCVDADSILHPDSLYRVLQPFLDDPRTVACGGTVRIVNGSTVRDGFVEKIGLPGSLLALFQIVEYLRAFLFGRLGWSPMNALLIISGAFGLFRKEVVVAAGGYRTDTVGEDMELVVRLHRVLRRAGKPYRIVFVPDPICWTEAPEDLRTLARQRIRWQRGLGESLTMNLGLMTQRRAGIVGRFAFPFNLLFELFGPLLEVAGYLFLIIAALNGWISPEVALVFLFAAVGLGIMLSTSALLLEELSFHVYPGFRSTLLLFTVAILENFGYRQLNSVWRLVGLLRWLTGREAKWGEMRRGAQWSRPRTPLE